MYPWPLKVATKNSLKCVKIQLLENIFSCCTLNDAKSIVIVIVIVIVLMYTKWA